MARLRRVGWWARGGRGIALTVVTFAGCSPDDSAGSDQLSDTPVPQWRLPDEPQWEIGAIEGPSELQFSGITAVGLSDSLVILFDRGSAELRVFDLAGEYRTALGGPGEGPGEFSPNVFFEADRDSLIVFDQRQRRATYFSPSLEYRSTIPVGLNLSNPRLVGVLDDGSYLLEELVLNFAEVTGRDAGDLIATRVDAHDPSVDTIGVFDGVETVRWSRTGMGLGIFSPYDRLDGDQDGLWVLDGATGEIQLLSPSGDMVVSFAPEFSRIPITEQDVNAYFAPLLAESPGPDLLESVRAQRAAALERGIFPVADRLFVDGPGRLWVRAYSVSGEQADVWHVFDQGGGAVGILEAPPSFEIHDASEAGVVGVHRDDLGVEYVRFYRIMDGGA